MLLCHIYSAVTGDGFSGIKSNCRHLGKYLDSRVSQLNTSTLLCYLICWSVSTVHLNENFLGSPKSPNLAQFVLPVLHVVHIQARMNIEIFHFGTSAIVQVERVNGRN